MDDRSALFLEVMIGIAVAAVVAFLITLVTARSRRPEASGKAGDGAALRSRWPQLLLAVVLLVAITLIVLWQFPPLGGESGADTSWRTQPNAMAFFIVMLGAGGLGLVVFLFYLFVRAQAPSTTTAGAEADAPPADAAQAQFATPAGTRLLGLLLLALAVLLLCWIYLPPALQYPMVLHLVYPATFAVALVLLFDKATRAWSVKTSGESVREWLLCDVATFFLVLGFLNLAQSNAGDKYAALIWDLLHVVLFFGVFWVLDRTASRLRFLVAYAYLTGLPILLLIWRANQGVAAAKDPNWWETIWPVFFLGVIFFVLEIIAVVAARDRERQGAATIKDVLSVILLGIALIMAVPGASE